MSCCVLFHTSAVWSIVYPHFLEYSSIPIFLILSVKKELTFFLRDRLFFYVIIVAHELISKTPLITLITCFHYLYLYFSLCWKAVLKHIFHFCITNTNHHIEHKGEGVMLKNICCINRMWPEGTNKTFLLNYMTAYFFVTFQEI